MAESSPSAIREAPLSLLLCMLLTGSSDKTLMIWHLTRDGVEYGYAKKALKGHNHFISDVVVSSDGQFALTASWGAF